MVNVNVMLEEILSSLSDVTVVCQHPEKFNRLPVVSYYEIGNTTGMCADNEEWGQKTYAAVDVWTKSAGECGEIAVKVDALMQKHGWRRELSRDMPPENGVRHKAMRFYKHIFFERND